MKTKPKATKTDLKLRHETHPQTTEKNQYKLVGYDTFSSEWYPLSGSYPTDKEAFDAAKERLKELEISQPSSSSGGQSYFGIQDQVYIEYPDGGKRRIT
ncbi:MAG: hypothetical protein ABR981_04060 [Candidatus Micrarchaeaceae archaeon]|jgi:hypothetical protein